jgi:hypothetical protein
MQVIKATLFVCAMAIAMVVAATTASPKIIENGVATTATNDDPCLLNANLNCRNIPTLEVPGGKTAIVGIQPVSNPNCTQLYLKLNSYTYGNEMCVGDSFDISVGTCHGSSQTIADHVSSGVWQVNIFLGATTLYLKNLHHMCNVDYDLYFCCT